MLGASRTAEIAQRHYQRLLLPVACLAPPPRHEIRNPEGVLVALYAVGGVLQRVVDVLGKLLITDRYGLADPYYLHGDDAEQRYYHQRQNAGESLFFHLSFF